MSERTNRRLFWGLAVTGALLDQATKYGVFAWLSNGGRGSAREVIPGLFELRADYLVDPITGEPLGLLRVNHGALFGFLSHHVGLANALFAAISLVAALAITYWAARPSARQDRGLTTALGLILGGTLGNLYDRLVFQGVRDFLHVYYQSFDWPVFNVADCCLVCGAALLLLQAFFAKPENAAEPAPANPSSQEMAQVP